MRLCAFCLEAIRVCGLWRCNYQVFKARELRATTTARLAEGMRFSHPQSSRSRVNLRCSLDPFIPTYTSTDTGPRAQIATKVRPCDPTADHRDQSSKNGKQTPSCEEATKQMMSSQKTPHGKRNPERTPGDRTDSMAHSGRAPVLIKTTEAAFL